MGVGVHTVALEKNDRKRQRWPSLVCRYQIWWYCDITDFL